MRESGRVLLDCEMDHPVTGEIREAIETHPIWSSTTKIADLHVWRVGKSRFAVILGLVTHDTGLGPEDVREVLAQHEELAHVSVEINYCRCEDNGS
jgi:Co/Zn/Cd efflux system component